MAKELKHVQAAKAAHARRRELKARLEVLCSERDAIVNALSALSAAPPESRQFLEERRGDLEQEIKCVQSALDERSDPTRKMREKRYRDRLKKIEAQHALGNSDEEDEEERLTDNDSHPFNVLCRRMVGLHEQIGAQSAEKERLQKNVRAIEDMIAIREAEAKRFMSVLAEEKNERSKATLKNVVAELERVSGRLSALEAELEVVMQKRKEAFDELCRRVEEEGV